jgi:uncharacterized protein (DUF736 family)
MLKEFLIFKAEKKSEKSPDFKISAKIDDKFVEIGAGWSRKSAKGTNFISCLLSKPYQDRKGFHLMEDENATQTLPVDDKQFLTPEEQARVKEEEFISI